MAGDINFKLCYIVPLHPGILRAHTVRKLGPEIPSELALSVTDFKHVTIEEQLSICIYVLVIELTIWHTDKHFQ